MDKIVRNGYVLVHNPTHHRAEENGYVYEHIVEAEKKLSRKLKPLEVVHHEDRDKANNSFENLFVFKTKSDHTRYHHNGIMIKENDYYVSHSVSLINSNCSICGVEFSHYGESKVTRTCSKECSDLQSRKTDRPSKEMLFDLIKEKSFSQIGREYGVSDNAVRKWCKSYGLPYRKKEIKQL